jgi:hypothetical protein
MSRQTEELSRVLNKLTARYGDCDPVVMELKAHLLTREACEPKQLAVPDRRKQVSQSWRQGIRRSSQTTGQAARVA